MRHPLKALVAVTAGVALVVLSAAPSAAQTGTVTGGTMTVNATLIPSFFPLGSGTSTDPNCVETIGITLDNHNASGTSTGHATFTLKIPFVYSAVNYVWSLSYSSSTVAITHTTTTSDHNVAISAFTVTDFNIYLSTGAGSCTPTTAIPRCANMDMAFFTTTALAGTFTGTISSTAPHDLSAFSTVHLAGVGYIAAVGCTPPFSGYNGKTATFASMTASF